MEGAEVVQVRKSERERKPVSCVLDEDVPGRKIWSKKKNSPNLQSEVPKYVEIFSEAPEGQGSSSRTLQPRKPVCYTEFQEPDVDSYIWCSGCGRLKYYGCETHLSLFADNNMFSNSTGKLTVLSQPIKLVQQRS